MTAKWARWWSVRGKGWTHFGMASIGVKVPDGVPSGGLTKKLMTCVWLAAQAKVETNLPVPMLHASCRVTNEANCRCGLGDWAAMRLDARTRTQKRMIPTRRGTLRPDDVALRDGGSLCRGAGPSLARGREC